MEIFEIESHCDALDDIHVAMNGTLNTLVDPLYPTCGIASLF